MKMLNVKGREVILDDEDYDRLYTMTWSVHVKGYVVCGTANDSGSRYLHHYILPAKAGMHVDHIDRNKLNNSRANLRYVTCRENVINSERSLRRDLPPRISRYGSGFRAKIMIKGKTYWLAKRPSLEQAQAALGAFMAARIEQT
jgi:hypothetical protein